MLNVGRVDVGEFLRGAGPLLREREVENNYPLRIAEMAKRDPKSDGEPAWFLLVRDDRGNLVSAGAMAPPHKLAFSRLDEEGIRSLLDFLLRHNAPLSGINAPKETSRKFAEAWASRTGGTFELGMDMRLYKLDKPPEGKFSKGILRVSTEADMPLLCDWVKGFEHDAHGGPVTQEKAEEIVRAWMANGKSYLWGSEEPVCMARSALPTGSGVCIMGVYTPPELRGKGHASAAVAALSTKLLKDGYKFVYLNANVENKTANSIYSKIGFKAAAEISSYTFIAAGPQTG